MMEQQRVVVVGGSSGSGEAAARLFLARGLDVLIAGRDPAKLERALDRLGGGTLQVVDATIPEDVARGSHSIATSAPAASTRVEAG